MMNRIPFDRDAITLSPPEARQLLVVGGFEILRIDYLFIFPNSESGSPIGSAGGLNPFAHDFPWATPI